tara:strand:- start:2992 stop:3228 length:237 start_codon:yes stop_codon:yes gene_type:complete
MSTPVQPYKSNFVPEGYVYKSGVDREGKMHTGFFRDVVGLGTWTITPETTVKQMDVWLLEQADAKPPYFALTKAELEQ